MALKHAVLAALASEEGSGYELSKRFDVSVANFWPASQQQVYRELDRLEQDELVKARAVRQDKRPDKRVFRITPAGRGELAAFIRATTKPTVIRDDLLVKVACVDESNSGEIAAAVSGRLEASREKLAAYEQIRAALLNGDSERHFLAAGPGRAEFGPYLALRRGIAFEKGNIRWAREVLSALE
ncbi:MAG: PadR family transcriptional regulator [Solirubrobacterales bacterium]|nr:PadR family transcriptional regulator [Solirubrobacterales bacterium]OJU95750.1 MAG: PadR family transcriptional regulator [Solirubrobacterales bacterium 67-14]